MAIQVSGVNVIDNERNLNVGVLTATSVDVPPSVISFSPTDGSSDVSLTSNIVITFNANVEKGSGNITLRSGSASGTVIETIAVSSGSVSISGGAVTINPSDFETGKDIFVVVDEGAFTTSSLESATNLINTYNFTTGPITTSFFTPSDGATNQDVTVTAQIVFSENITKGSGNITLRAGSASGTIRQTIDVTSSAVTISGRTAIINPPSDLEYEEDTYFVVDAGCFRNSDGDVASGNAVVNTYNFTTEQALTIPPLGQCNSTIGGYLICCASSNLWIVAPVSTEVQTNWFNRMSAINAAQNSTGCSGWFLPTRAQLQNPGWTCRTYWDSYKNTATGINGRRPWQSGVIGYISNSFGDMPHNSGPNHICDVYFQNGQGNIALKSHIGVVRAFRCVSY
jgi:hypothetical protein